MMKEMKILPALILIALTSSCTEEAITSQSSALESSEAVAVTSDKVILGRDNRQNTTNLNSSFDPYKNKVGELVAHYVNSNNEEKKSTCTATLVRPEYIMTAAHCVYDRNGKRYQNQYFYPGRNGKNQTPLGKYKVDKIWHPKNYSHHYIDQETDIALIKLAKNEEGKTAGQRAGSLGTWGTKNFPTGEVLTIGYPGDKPSGKQYYEKGCSVQRDGYKDSLNVYCDVFQGQSGSPVLFYSQKHGNYYLHGVLNSETDHVNYGAYFTYERHQILKLITVGKFNTTEYKNKAFQEEWVEVAAAENNFVQASVRNTCSNRKLYISFYYKNPDNNWNTRGYFTLGPNEDLHLLSSKNGIYYIGAVTEGGRDLTRKDTEKYLSAMGEDVPMQKYHAKKWGYYTHNFGCR